MLLFLTIWKIRARPEKLKVHVLLFIRHQIHLLKIRTLKTRHEKSECTGALIIENMKIKSISWKTESTGALIFDNVKIKSMSRAESIRVPLFVKIWKLRALHGKSKSAGALIFKNVKITSTPGKAGSILVLLLIKIWKRQWSN